MRILQISMATVATMACLNAYEPLACTFPSYEYEQRWCDTCDRPKKEFRTGAPALRFVFNGFGSAVKDAIDLNLNIISKDTFIVIAATMCPYLIARQFDDGIQCHFFSHTSHKNINQCPKWCQELVRFSLAVPIVIFGSQLFLSSDPVWKESAWMLLLGIPFVIFGKDLIKTFDTDFCLRPWHEDFMAEHKRSSGGFPSGHMAQAAYIATLYGTRFGHKMAVPLTFFAAGLGIVFLNCNRHYLSQLIAGAGLGAIYGLAANKVIDRKLSENWKMGLTINRDGPAIKARYRF